MLYDQNYNFAWPRLLDDRYDLTVITPPAVEPVNVEFLMAQCNVDNPDDAPRIARLGKASRMAFERACHGLVLITTTYQIAYDAFDCHGLDIPVRPVQSIVSIKYDDMAGIEQTLDPSTYQLDRKTVSARVFPKYGYVWPLTIPNANAVRIQFIAGITGDADLVPDTIKLAIGQWVSTNNENRESILVGKTAAKLPHAYDSIVSMYDAPRF